MYTQKNSIGVDWIGFTSFLTFPDVMEFLGFEKSDLFKLECGRHGYDTVYKVKDFSAFIMKHSNREEMGIHVDITGSSIDDMFHAWVEWQKIDSPVDSPSGFEVEYNICDFLASIRQIGHFTRLDVCFDDFEFEGQKPFYTPSDLKDIQKSGRLVSKFRTFKFVDESSSNESTGSTFYMGSRTSGCMLRVYDKKCEQNKKLKTLGKPLLTDDWVRWELEMHDYHANKFVDSLCSDNSVGGGFLHAVVLCKYFQEVLNGLLRIVNLDDTNKSRCSTDEKWLAFVETVETASLSIKAFESTLSKKLGWVKRSVVPTLVSLFVGFGYSWDWLLHNVDDTCRRLTGRMKNTLNQIDSDYMDILHLIEDSVGCPKPLFECA